MWGGSRARPRSEQRYRAVNELPTAEWNRWFDEALLRRHRAYKRLDRLRAHGRRQCLRLTAAFAVVTLFLLWATTPIAVELLAALRSGICR